MSEAMKPANDVLPINGFLPRHTTAPLTHQTGADGTKVTIAVFDTGVDPGAVGLTQTLDGRRKVIDVIDCTSCGDVTLHPVKINDMHILEAYSGRQLRVPSSIRQLNPSGQYRIGIKHAYDFFPFGLVSRLRSERREIFDKQNKPLIAQTRLKLSKLRQQQVDREQQQQQQQQQSSSSSLTKQIENEIDETEAQLNFLLGIEKNYHDTGPVYDCIAFRDQSQGGLWRAIIDTSECGDLSKCDILETYAIHGRFSQFPNGLFLNFAVNIFDDGHRLSIVVDSGSHGTHVAGIIAANFPDKPHLNGLAPNAQIVSLKIGDSRVSGMETHQGLTRALAYCMAHSPKLPTAATLDQQNNVNQVQVDKIPKTEETNSDSSTIETSSTVIDNAGTTSTELSSNNATTSIPKSTTDKKDGLNNPSLVISSTTPHSTTTTTTSATTSASTSVKPPTSTSETTAINPASTSSTSSSQPRPPPITIDIVNMSFGEHTRDAENGRFVELANDMVRKHDVIFVSSAGNEGPGLSSVSAPGGTTSSIIGVGAFCTSQMARQAYHYLESEYDESSSYLENETSSSSSNVVVGTPYHWSSRGPVVTGDLGVSICAPGGAIAPVPRWNLRSKQFMNGTSMSSPSAAGSIAVLLSYLKSKHIPYTSALIRRAVENTARPMRLIHSSEKVTDEDDSLLQQQLKYATGQGCIDALAASQYIENYMALRKKKQQQSIISSNTNVVKSVTNKDNSETSKIENEEYYDHLEDCGDSSLSLENWHFSVTVNDAALKDGAMRQGMGNLNASKGVYLRGTTDTQQVRRATVFVSLVGYDEKSLRVKEALSNLEVRFRLSCDAKWVKVTQSFLHIGVASRFFIVIDPTGLTPGHSHYAEVIGTIAHTDNSSTCGGPVFRVPISVQKPEKLINGITTTPIMNMPFAPGKIMRRFYEVPFGATFAMLRVIAGDDFVNQNNDVHNDNNNTMSGLVPPLNGMNDAASVSSSVTASRLISTYSPATSINESTTKNVSSGGGVEQQRNTIDVNTPLSAVNNEQLAANSGIVRTFDTHFIQLLPQLHIADNEARKKVVLHPGAVRECVVKVFGGCPLEFSMAQILGSAGRCRVNKIEIIFSGLIPRPTTLHASSSMLTFPRIEVGNLLAPSQYHQQQQKPNRQPPVISGFSPRASLTHVCRGITSKSTSTTSLKGQDMIPGHGPTIELRVEFIFDVPDTCNVLLSFPILEKTVYEAGIEGGPFVIVHDAHKRYMFSSDIYPVDHHLMKGEYSATAYIRSTDIEILETLRQHLSLTVRFALKSELQLHVFDNGHAACLGSNAREIDRTLVPLEYGDRRAVFFATPKRSSLPKWIIHGDVLVGTMTFDKLIATSFRRGSDVPSYVINYTIGANNSGSSSSSKSSKRSDETEKHSQTEGEGKEDENKSEKEKIENKEKKEEPSKEPEIESAEDKWMEEALKKLRMKRLKSSLEDRKEGNFMKVFNFTKYIYPDDVDVYTTRVEWADTVACRHWEDVKECDNVNSEANKKLREKIEEVNIAVQEAVSKMNVSEIVSHYGCNIDTDDRKAVETREKFDKKKQKLIECLFRNARSQSLLFVSNHTPNKFININENDKKTFETNIKELIKWTCVDGKGCMPGASSQGMSTGSVTNEDLMLLAVVREAVRGRFGGALRCMDNFYGSSAKRQDSERVILLRRDILNAIGWKNLAEAQELYLISRFPKHEMPY